MEVPDPRYVKTEDDVYIAYQGVGASGGYGRPARR